MNFDDCFNELDKITKNEVEIKDICCDDTNNYNLIEGVIICKKCNKTISNITDNPEWRFYGSNDTKNTDPTRCGLPVNILLPKSSVGSIVANQYLKDNSMKKVQQYAQWTSMTYKERSMYKVFTELDSIGKNNNLSLIIINEAKSLYKIISDIQISRGNNRKGIIASCVYFACKNCGVSRSPKELAEMFNITTPIMTKGVKTFQEIFNTSNINKNRITNVESIKPEDFISRFSNKLNLNDNHISIIIKMPENIKNSDIMTEIRPDSIAAGCILLYSNQNKLNINKKDISKICKISEVTINKCCKRLENYLNQ